jgi:hypothetical protein
MADPGYIGHRGFGLRAGGVQDQHIDRAQAFSDRGGQPGDLLLVGDIGAETLGGTAIVTDRAADSWTTKRSRCAQIIYSGATNGPGGRDCSSTGGYLCGTP